ncbi:MAG TPA: hypothetical protein GXX73_14125 [Clostridium sp.]|nr:hypothetical protein [Clostridium sp.]
MKNPDEKYQVEEYLRHFSKEIGKEIKDYAINEALLHSRYMFVKTIKNKQYGYCTHCGEEYEIKNNIRAYNSNAWTTRGKLKHNSQAQCPRCNSYCTVKHDSYGRNKLCDKAYFVYYDKSIIDPKVITARGIIVTRNYKKSYREPITFYEVPYLYVFEIGKSVMLKENYIMGYEKTRTVYTGYNNFNFSNIPLMCSYDSINKAVKNTPFEFSPYKRFFTPKKTIYVKNDMVEFFSIFSKFPVIEILDKIGFKKIVDEKMYSGNYGKAVNWRGKELHKIFRLNKQDFSTLKSIAKIVDIDSVFLKFYQISVNDGSRLKPNEIDNIRKIFSNYNFQYVEELLNHTKNLRKTYNYLKKQTDNDKEHFPTIYDVISQWVDYIRQCKKLGYNLNDTYIVFPKSLREAHQKATKLIKYKENKKYDAKIKRRLKELNKYYFEYNGLFIRPARSTKELIDEGSALVHCVGDYAKSYAEGRTNIFFIRKLENPNIPFYTVEITKSWFSNELEIKQCRSYKNKTPEENNHPFVREFINIFEKEKLFKNENKVIEHPA